MINISSLQNFQVTAEISIMLVVITVMKHQDNCGMDASMGNPMSISLASSYQSMNLFVCQLPGIRALVFYVIAHHDISSFCKAEYLLAREIIGEKRKIMTQNGPLPPLYIFSFFPFKLNLN